MPVAYFDGDDIGPFLELLLLDNRLEDARSYSSMVSLAVSNLAKAAEKDLQADVVVCGGDDVIITWPGEDLAVSWIQKACAQFFGDCQRTVSVGIGSTAPAALGSLRRAKLLGKGQIVTSGVESLR
jgi:hypothetical protein